MPGLRGKLRLLFRARWPKAAAHGAGPGTQRHAGYRRARDAAQSARAARGDGAVTNETSHFLSCSDNLLPPAPGKSWLPSLTAPPVHCLCFVFPKATREENDGTLRQGPADTQDPGTDGRRSEEGNGASPQRSNGRPHLTKLLLRDRGLSQHGGGCDRGGPTAA